VPKHSKITQIKEVLSEVSKRCEPEYHLARLVDKHFPSTYKSAIALYERAYDKCPDNPLSKMGEIMLSHENNAYEAFVTAWMNGDLSFEAALNEYRQVRYVFQHKNVMELYKKAYEKYPNNPAVWIESIEEDADAGAYEILAGVLMNGDFEGALNEFLQAQYVFEHEAKLRDVVNRYKDAVTLFKQAWKMNSDVPIGQMEAIFETKKTDNPCHHVPFYTELMTLLTETRGFSDALICYIKVEQELLEESARQNSLDKDIRNLKTLLAKSPLARAFLQQACTKDCDKLLDWMKKQIESSNPIYNTPKCTYLVKALTVIPDLKKKIPDIVNKLQSQEAKQSQSNESSVKENSPQPKQNNMLSLGPAIFSEEKPAENLSPDGVYHSGVLQSRDTATAAKVVPEAAAPSSLTP
jgi:tetratricopeptide (TPR) repeat protein